MNKRGLFKRKLTPLQHHSIKNSVIKIFQCVSLCMQTPGVFFLQIGQVLWFSLMQCQWEETRFFIWVKQKYQCGKETRAEPVFLETILPPKPPKEVNQEQYGILGGWANAGGVRDMPNAKDLCLFFRGMQLQQCQCHIIIWEYDRTGWQYLSSVGSANGGGGVRKVQAGE